MMNRRDGIKRYLVFFVGLFINSFGVSFVTKACMGTSPISSIPYTLSLIFNLSLGTYTLYMSLILVLLQIPFSFIFSWFIDCTMEWLLVFLSINVILWAGLFLAIKTVKLKKFSKNKKRGCMQSDVVLWL